MNCIRCLPISRFLSLVTRIDAGIPDAEYDYEIGLQSPAMVLLDASAMLLRVGCYVSSSSQTAINHILSTFMIRYCFLLRRNRCGILGRPFLCTVVPSIVYVSTRGINSMCTSSGAKPTKKSRHQSPEGLLKFKLDACSKNSDLVEALRLYEEAQSNGVQLSLHHYNNLLYLCSSHSTSAGGAWGDGNDCMADIAVRKGFELYKQMSVENVAPNESTFTSAARMAALAEDPQMAFDLIKQMKSCGIPPKLRSYEPALFGFCRKGDLKMAFEVDEDMIESGLCGDESMLSALLKISVSEKNDDRVYEVLHRLRSSVRQVSPQTAEIMEDWFNSDVATKVGCDKWDVQRVREAVSSGGGGWHGQGWLGSGKWNVTRTKMDNKGICCSCGEQLVCIDIDPGETDNFASSLMNLACQKEVKANFREFQEWLHCHGPFDAVVDGANVGLVKQHSFNFYQIKNVVNQLRQLSPSKKFPLIVLHKSRIHRGPAKHPSNKELIDFWKKSGALYCTPPGSNDDWYWLYAAVSCNCLLVTNDEMRDHLLQLLGTGFFPRWKEKHQVRLTPYWTDVILHMPPPYSVVIQESERGSWHIPVVGGDDVETPREWICAARENGLLYGGVQKDLNFQ